MVQDFLCHQHHLTTKDLVVSHTALMCKDSNDPCNSHSTPFSAEPYETALWLSEQVFIMRCTVLAGVLCTSHTFAISSSKQS